MNGGFEMVMTWQDTSANCLTKVNKLTLGRSRLGVRLKTAKADTKASGARAEKTARRLAKLTSKEAASR